MSVKLTRYWLTFADEAVRMSPLHFGLGVTAFHQEDALGLAQRFLSGGDATLEIVGLVENVDVRSLDQDHVAPNMRPPNLRGVWFPLSLS